MGQSSWAIVCALLLNLAAARGLAAQESDNAIPITQSAEARDFAKSAEERIEQLLDLPLREPLEAVERPLNDVMHEWSDMYDIPILFDTPALDAVALSPDVPATITLKEVSLRSALNLILSRVADNELTYVVADEVLLITTREGELRRSTVRVYRIEDLESDEEHSWVGSGADFNSLVDMITSCVEPESWLENGTGDGDIHPCPPGLIVVKQSPNVHRQIEGLLSSLRREKAAIEAKHAAARQQTNGRAVTLVISLPNEILTAVENRELLCETLKRSVDWQLDDSSGVAEGDVFIQVLPNLVIVRHLPHVVDQVAALVRQMKPHSAAVDTEMSAVRCGTCESLRAERQGGLAAPQ